MRKNSTPPENGDEHGDDDDMVISNTGDDDEPVVVHYTMEKMCRYLKAAGMGRTDAYHTHTAKEES